MSTSVRRVVTGTDSAGKAVIVSDGPPPIVHTQPQRPGLAINEIWITDSMPAKTRQDGEPTDRPRRTPPPKDGTRFCVTELPPDPAYVDIESAKSVYAAGGAVHGGKDAPHPFMHKTESVDYCIVLSGEVYLVLDDSETLLKTGDIVVQRGTNHAWSNRSGAPCRLAFILVDGTWET